MWRWVWRGSRWLAGVWAVGALTLLVGIILYGDRDFARPADVIIVLGAGVEADGSVGATFRTRIERGHALWAQGLAPVLICTGGVTGPAARAEAEACRDALLELGVPLSDIYLETSSRNTYENAQYALEIVQAQDWENVLVVSSRYHLLRARWLFWRAGQPIYTVPAPIGHLTRTEVIYAYGREVAAFHWQVLRDVLGVPHIRVPVP